MANFTALFDANVLFSPTKTQIVVELARAGLYRARWSEDIHPEWIRNVLAKFPTLDPASIDRRREAMDRSILDVLVTGYQPLIAGLTGFNAKDRHVVAAAIEGRCDVIVTENLADFPQADLDPFQLEAQHPDVFLMHQKTLNEHRFLATVKKCRTDLKKPPYSPDEYLDLLRKNNLPITAAELDKVKNII